MPETMKLLVCELDDGGPKIHPCRKAQDALDRAGIVYEKQVHDKNRPLGLFTKGKRPELKQLSGQEKLPVLVLGDGSTVNGGGAIADWAQAQAGR
ncbi:MAG: hypothetical protein NVSMB51_13460 [Solirubrobacteraceae bacterium]